MCWNFHRKPGRAGAHWRGGRARGSAAACVRATRCRHRCGLLCFLFPCPQCAQRAPRRLWLSLPGPDMNVRDSVRALVRAYPGGVDAIAPRMGKSPSTLDKELRAAPGFKLGLDDSATVAEMCHDLGMPEARSFVTALAARMDCLVVPLPGGVAHCDDQCMKAVAEASREMHELMTETLQALADGRVNDNERLRVERAGAELVSAVQALLQLMAARNEAGKPGVLS